MIPSLRDKTREEILWQLTIHVGTPSCNNLILQSANSRFDSLADFRLSLIISKDLTQVHLLCLQFNDR